MTVDPATRRGVVVTWIGHHGRSARLAAHAGLEAAFMPWAAPRRSLPRQLVSWSRSAARTWSVVRRQPDGAVVVAVSPPVFAVAVSLAAAGRSRTVVMDAHSGTFNDPRWTWSHRLVRACARRCAAVLVTNHDVTGGLLDGTTKVLVVHDPLVDRSRDSVPPRARRPYIVMPASGAPDEPLSALDDAAELLRDEVDVVVTGPLRPQESRRCLQCTGMLPEHDYWSTLHGAAAVIALTTREGTMQRAAYEALEAARPLVCSDTAALQGALGCYPEYCVNTGDDIAAAVRRALARPDEQWPAAARSLRARLNDETAAALRRAIPAHGDREPAAATAIGVS